MLGRCTGGKRKGQVMAKGKFGPRMKELRIKAGLTLREFCARGGFDPGNYSRVERGLFSPPGEDKIREYAEVLAVKIGSDEYVDLIDKACIDRGELPSDLLDDEELVNELPVLFRTVRGEKVEEGQLDRFIDMLRRR